MTQYLEIPLDLVCSQTGLSDRELDNPEYGLEIIRQESKSGAGDTVRWSGKVLPSGDGFERFAEMARMRRAKFPVECELATDRLLGPQSGKTKTVRSPRGHHKDAGALLADAFDAQGFNVESEPGHVIVSARPPTMGIFQFAIPIRVGEVRFDSAADASLNGRWVAELQVPRHRQAFRTAVASAAAQCGATFRVVTSSAD